MKFHNPNHLNLETLQERILDKYPMSKIRKTFLGQQILFVDYSDFKMMIREKGDHFTLDYNPPTIWQGIVFLIGFIMVLFLVRYYFGNYFYGLGFIWMLLLHLITKVVYKSINKDKFETFEYDIQEAINHKISSEIF